MFVLYSSCTSNHVYTPDTIPENPAYKRIAGSVDLDLTADDFRDFALYQNLDKPTPNHILRKMMTLKQYLNGSSRIAKEQINKYNML